jgi:transcriptional regulator with XRE-family HTH domain
MQLGRRLKRLRDQRGLSQLGLAKQSRVAQGYISAIEAGTKTNPGIETLRKLAQALGVPVATLLAESPMWWKAEERLDARVFPTREEAERVARKIGSPFVWRLQEKVGEFIQRGPFPIEE